MSQARLGPGRIRHCMRWLGMKQRAFELMCQYATQREVFGTTLARKANIQDWIAEAHAEIHAARLMTLHTAWKIDAAGANGAREEISLIKFFIAKMLHSVVDKAVWRMMRQRAPRAGAPQGGAKGGCAPGAHCSAVKTQDPVSSCT